MAALIYQIFSSSTLLSQGLYHPLHHHCFPFLRHYQILLVILCLFVTLIHRLIVYSYADPLLKVCTPVHLFTSLHSASIIFSFRILSAALLLSKATSILPIHSDLFFDLLRRPDLRSPAHCVSVSACISALSSFLFLALALTLDPRLFIADVALGDSFCLQGLWALQTGLSLYVEAFIP